MRGRYADQVVLVTGGAQGLGLAMAERFAAEGATVYVADLRSAAEQGVGAGTITTAPVDVTASGAVATWVHAIMGAEGRIDVLVNNAGIIRDNRLENISESDWDSVIATSLTGAFLCSQAVWPHLKAQGYGRLLSFSSMSWRGNFGQANYVAAKAGVVGLARAMALEGARHGITSNAIAPGLIETPMLASMNAKARDKLVSKVPIGAAGSPADIAAAAAFLCSREAGYVTGVVLDVDGGLGVGASIR
ncbi:3-oxoacyl-(acyl-carrier-protein) reductase [metagenome]|uniref:3-oxoacyl-(Acyl-carrier-protein) reductase n=1 Tax=metagenome TaxID=256318 RepID=A0A2P2C3X7_9ZZZZ